jgi:hypothetical protein
VCCRDPLESGPGRRPRLHVDHSAAAGGNDRCVYTQLPKYQLFACDCALFYYKKKKKKTTTTILHLTTPPAADGGAQGAEMIVRGMVARGEIDARIDRADDIVEFMYV